MSSPHIDKKNSPLGLWISGRGTELSTGLASISPESRASSPYAFTVVLDKSQALIIYRTYDEYTPNQKNEVGVDVNEHSSLNPRQITKPTFFNKSENAAFLTAKGEPMIHIGEKKAEALAALYNASKPLGMGYLHYTPGDMAIEEAQNLIEGQKSRCVEFGAAESIAFDYLKGRVMKVDLTGNEFDPRLYDRDNGQGAAARALSHLFENAA